MHRRNRVEASVVESKGQRSASPKRKDREDEDATVSTSSNGSKHGAKEASGSPAKHNRSASIGSGAVGLAHKAMTGIQNPNESGGIDDDSIEHKEVNRNEQKSDCSREPVSQKPSSNSGTNLQLPSATKSPLETRRSSLSQLGIPGTGPGPGSGRGRGRSGGGRNDSN